MYKKEKLACAMSVAGSDSGGGAGIQADLLTFAANAVYGCTAIAALTAQNPSKVSAIGSANAALLSSQMETVCEFFKPSAAKTGMLFDVDSVSAAADFFERNTGIALVVDPVMISTSGAKLLKDDAAKTLAERLIPLSTVFTPNLDEGAELLGISRIFDVSDAAKRLRDKFGASVLLKGGHIEGDDLTDALACSDGSFFEMKSKRVGGVNTHGSGCTLSAAIAANLAKGAKLTDACLRARDYLLRGMKNALETDGGKFINHFPDL